MSSHGDPLRPAGATRLDDVDLGARGVDAQTESGKLQVAENGVLVIDRETVDDPFGEGAIWARVHRFVPAHAFEGTVMSLSDKRLFQLLANAVSLDRVRHDDRHDVTVRIHVTERKWCELAPRNRKRDESG